MKNILILFFFYWIKISFTQANGVTVSNGSISSVNTSSNYCSINFNITWDNSWRVSSGPSNWDACWVFVKYKVSGQSTWHHATLSTTDANHTAPTGSTIKTSSDGKGIFIYSSTNITNSTVNYTGGKLRWNYGTDGVSDGANVDIIIFAIEMVYVPQGSFFVGDGTSSNLEGHFESGTSGTPLQITSENALTLGGGGVGSLGNNNAVGMWAGSEDDFNDATSKSLPAAFPKGFKAFYCMKYEISQQQYVDFLNTLTYTQQVSRTATAPTSSPGTGALINTNTYRNGIDIKTSGTNSTTPAVYACNLDGDANYDETNDGQYIACNYLNWAHLTAYLDWSGLRPLSDLEFEKACRGTNASVIDEYAWGTTGIASSSYTISNSGQIDEGISSNYSTTNGNASYSTTALGGVIRNGIYSANSSNTGRITSGATFYGIMEMSGNAWERIVTVGNSTGRLFTGNHGDGALDNSGDPNVSGWPGTSGTGGGYRGGDFQSGSIYLRVSSRIFASNVSTFLFIHSGRGCRTAP